MPDAGEMKAPSDDRKPCVACREPIQPGARVCPHCRSSQVPAHWKLVGAGLKWVGGTAAVISLVMGMHQADSLFQNWRARQETVAELVKAAAMETAAADYSGSWKLYEQALGLEPGSPAARNGEVDLAMVWLRHMSVTGDQTFSQVVDPLLPVLYRAAANRKGPAAADALAHIGWANFLKNRDLGISDVELWGPKVDELFARALTLDPNNVYAHAMLGFWILYRHGRPADASRQFEAALKSGRERQYVLETRLWALLNNEDEESALEQIKAADEMRQHGDPAPAGQRRRIAENALSLVRSSAWSDRLLAAVPAADQLKTLAWLSRDDGVDTRSPSYRLYHARLSEAAANGQAALEEYRALQASADVAPDISQAAAEGIARIGHGTAAKPH